MTQDTYVAGSPSYARTSTSSTSSSLRTHQNRLAPLPPLPADRDSAAQRSLLHQYHSYCDTWYNHNELANHRYHLICRLLDAHWYSTAATTQALSIDDIETHILANRLVIETLDFKPNLSLYMNERRVLAVPIGRGKRSRTRSPREAPHDPPVLFLTHVQSSDADAPLLPVLSVASPFSSFEWLLSGYPSDAELDKFVALVCAVDSTPRSDLWLDVPDGARLQVQLRDHVDAIEQQISDEMSVAREQEIANNASTAAVASSNYAAIDDESRTNKTVLQKRRDRVSSPSKRDQSSSLLIPVKSARYSQLAGFKNVGNSCYINAILQSLLSVSSFVADLCDDSIVQQVVNNTLQPAENLYNTKIPAVQPYSFYNALVDIVVKMKRNDHGVIDMAPLKSSMASRFQAFDNDLQQDAHEFLSECLNGLNEDIQPLTSASNSSEVAGIFFSPIDRNFHTEIEFTLTCTNPSCGYTRNNHESFHDLSLDIPEASSTTQQSPSRYANNNVSPLLQSSPSPESSPSFTPLTPCSCPYVPPMSLLRQKQLDLQESQPDTVSNHSQLRMSSNPLKKPRAVRPRKNVVLGDLPTMLAKFFDDRLIECKCSECDNNQVRVSAKISKLPRVLILHLKRFLPNVLKGTYEKRSDRVNIAQTLDLGFVCTKATQQPPGLEFIAHSHIELDRRVAVLQTEAESITVDPLPTLVETLIAAPPSGFVEAPLSFADQRLNHISTKLPHSLSFVAPASLLVAPPSSGDLCEVSSKRASPEPAVEEAPNVQNKRQRNNRMRVSPPIAARIVIDIDSASTDSDSLDSATSVIDLANSPSNFMVNDYVNLATDSVVREKGIGDDDKRVTRSMQKKMANSNPKLMSTKPRIFDNLISQSFSSASRSFNLPASSSSGIGTDPISADVHAPASSNAPTYQDTNGFRVRDSVSDATAPPPVSPYVYRLLSIVQHRGPAAYAGHYLTDIRHRRNGVDEDDSIWTRYDDQFVRHVTREQALRQADQQTTPNTMKPDVNSIDSW